ncbi:class I SAM-dependent methyltransferase [Sciscionella sediminilitoris]|uniref:class I SAM-dependent methyltransferase n=1 Tax=Sciscionella sediminilitoris TaxID=1445613 RepID=UPI0004DF2674|nr:class I SAM-dependent methyltransferase [Sciscionella sp. SE31]
MEQGQPSKTALATGYWRAYHQVLDEPRVLEDPLALRILRLSPDELTDQDTEPWSRFGGTSGSQLGRRLFFATRSRFAEEVIGEAVRAGTRQVVFLGAGLDTFAYRNPFPELRVFEVDHPATQSWKRQQLAEADIPVPDSVTFAPVDFETDSLSDGLAAAGFDRGEPAIFVWLGVVFYLTQDAFQETLRYITGQRGSVRLVLDYLPAPATADEQAALRDRMERLMNAGEPFLSMFPPTEMEQQLSSAGFTTVEDHSAAALIEHYRGAPLPEGAALPKPASRLLQAGR